MSELFHYLSPCLPQDHARQVHSRDSAKTALAQHKQAKRILDLGCGNGNSIDFFRREAPNAEWFGIDIETSPEVDTRQRTDGRFVTFDGVDIPFKDGSFDVIYSHQVLEHVRHPERLLKEVARVLAKDGVFVGSTSQFEPYHSFSVWNYTVYGFKRILEDAGLELTELRPGIDGMTLIRRSFLGRPKEMSKYFAEESPLNEEIEATAKAAGRDIRTINFRKLVYCGQFVFQARRAG